MGAEHHLGLAWEAEFFQAELAGPRPRVQDHQKAGTGAWPEEGDDVLGMVGEGQQGEVRLV